MDPYKSYLSLRAKDLKASPQDPQTIQEFCERTLISIDQVRSFHENPQFEDDLRQAATSWLQSQIPALLHLAVSQARLSKDVGDIEKLVEIAYRLKSKGDASQNTLNIFNISDEKAARIAQRFSLRAPKS